VPPLLTRRAFLSTAAAVASTAAAGCGVLGPKRANTPYLFGLHVGQNGLFDKLHRAEGQANRRADVVLMFAKIHEPFPDTLHYLYDQGYTVALCLEIWDGGQLINPTYGLAAIARGDHDADLRRWLTELGTLPRPVHLRTLHEFNGNWYPWCVFTEGNRVTEFLPAWRHVASLARQTAGDQIRLQLCFNRQNGYDPRKGTEYPGTASLFFPGRRYVDELVLNAYNRPTYERSHSFATLVERYYRELRDLRSGLPLWIGETASTEKFGDKPQWTDHMLQNVLVDYPVSCMTWFNENLRISGEPHRDWKFDTTPASLDAFRRGIRPKKT